MPAETSVGSVTAHPAALATLLNSLTQATGTGRDARELTEWLLRQITRVTGWPVAQALLVDSSGAVTYWFSSRSNETRWEAYTLTLGELAMRTPTGMIDRVITARRPGWVADISGEADYPRASAARSVGLRGTFAFPVLRGEHVVAVLQFLSQQPIVPDTDFQDAMRVAGHLLGNAFEKLRLDGESADQPSRLHRVMDAGTSAFFALDAGGRVVEWATTAELLFGWTRAEAVHRRMSDLLLLPQPQAGSAPGDGPGPRHWEATARRRDGSTFDVEVSRWHVASGRGSEDHDFFFCRDVSEHRQRAAGLMRDPLTGLGNRAGMVDLLAGRLARDTGAAEPGPVLMLVGLERFKEIDYSTHHPVADEALRVIGARLAAFAADVDRRAGAADAACSVDTVVARVNGDEFAILFDALTGTSEISGIAERVVDVVSEPFEVAGRRLALSANVGVAAPLLGSDVTSWFGDAEAALYRCQNGITGGRGPQARFEIEGFARRQGASWRQNLPAEMQVALTEGQFELYFQPVFTTADRAISGAEVLLRWHHPQHGLLLPGSFIPAAEDSGMITPIGEWVLQAACQQLREWSGANLRIAVNLGAPQLSDPGIVARLTDAVASLNGDGGLVVEMTEGVLMADPAVAATRIGQFRDMGVQVAIDDFGTGYSSLAYLKWFDVDAIKIDMSFVHGMEASRTDASIVRAIIDLAGALDLHVVAEGVETDEQLRLLTDLGCSHVQGFGLGRPGPAADLTARLRR